MPLTARIALFIFHSNHKCGPMIQPILQMRRLRNKETKKLALSSLLIQQVVELGLHLEILTPESACLPFVPCLRIGQGAPGCRCLGAPVFQRAHLCMCAQASLTFFLNQLSS